MENVNFPQGGECGEDIERALMDLGPLLGVTIKEEVPDELPDRAASQGNVRIIVHFIKVLLFYFLFPVYSNFTSLVD